MDNFKKQGIFCLAILLVLGGFIVFSNSASAVSNTVKPQITSWYLSVWHSTGSGSWLQQPVLTINGKDYKYATPQEYITQLQSLKAGGATGSIDQYIKEFQNVIPEFAKSNAGSAIGQAPVQENPNTQVIDQASPSNLQANVGAASLTSAGLTISDYLLIILVILVIISVIYYFIKRRKK